MVENCARKEIFIPEELLIKKNSNVNKVNIIYLANLVPEKGYKLLLDAYISLPDIAKDKAMLNFAGEFPDYRSKTDFLNEAAGENNVFYQGPVQSEKKLRLLWDSHIFCLPTSCFEAQPISILEAYAAGCIVLTTNKGGIKDIFSNGVNGYWIPNGDKTALKDCLELLILNIDKYKSLSFHNYQQAIEKYTESRFNREIEEILMGCAL